MSAVDDYIAAQREPQRSTLSAMRSAIRRLLPRAEECVAYGIPAWRVDGTAVAGIAAATKHCSYFPHSGSTVASLGATLEAYDVAKGTLRFAVDEPLPAPLLRKLVRARLAEISMSPDRKGVTRDFYDDGGLKAKGRMLHGKLHGAWTWWRRDGSVMRTGSFDRGRQVGAWTTCDAAGKRVKTTDMGS
jgi:uncharacterized protein YdhG (YjbR/CyaY superfamily)